MAARGNGGGESRVIAGMRGTACSLAVLLGMGALAAACSGSASSTPQTATTVPVPASVPRATVTGPVTGEMGIDLAGTTTFDLSSVGYEQSEYFLSGTASAYTSTSPLTSNGRWTVTPASTAEYKTRMVVYRPIDPARFDGTVIVEWLNVSGGVDAAAAWLTDHVQMIRSGTVYIGVSAQAAGIVGASGSLGASNGVAGGIKGADPARYGSLVHPGDSYSYSIFEQAGAAVHRDAAIDPRWTRAEAGTRPRRVAVRLSAGHLHRRAATPVTRGLRRLLRLQPRRIGCSPLPGAPIQHHPPTPTFIRTDLDVPGHVVRDRSRRARPRLPPCSTTSDAVHP